MSWLRTRLAGPPPDAALIDASAIQARRAALILAVGVILGACVALVGGIVGALIDSGPRSVGALLYGPILILLPVVAYAIAIALLRSAIARLNSADREQREQLIRARRSLASARTAVMIGLIPNGFLALFGGLAFIGPADTFDSGAALSALAAIGAEWVILPAAIVAMVWIGSSRRLTPALVSADGNWWWDGRSWQPVPSGRALPVQQTVQVVSAGVQADAGTPRQAVVAYSQPLNPLAVVSGVAAILSWLVCPIVAAIAAVVTGHIALVKIRRNREGGRGWALTGVILGYLNLALFVGLGAWAVLS